MINYITAMEKLLAKAQPINELDWVNATEAYARVSGEDVRSGVDVPGFPRSAMDGFAVKVSDLKDVPVTLNVVDDLPAGKRPEKKVGSGQAIRIMTGAMMPPGADAVVMAEDTEDMGDKVVVKKSVSAGDNVAPQGEDVKKGELILSKGTVIDWRHIGLLCACGVFRVKVVRKPRVAVITTGDEIVEPWEEAEPPAVRNVNRYMLEALVKEAGGEVVLSAHVRDSVEDVKSAFEKAFDADVILFNAGISTGVHDVVRAFVRRSAEEVFYKVAIKPGKPIYFGMVGGKPLFGLPGYPASTAITFVRFVKPFLRRMLGVHNSGINGLWATSGEDIPVKGKRETLLRVKLERGYDGWIFYQCPPHKAGTIFSISKSHGYVLVDPAEGGVRKGLRYFVYFWKEMLL